MTDGLWEGQTFPLHDDLVQETYARLLRVSDPQRLVHARAGGSDRVRPFAVGKNGGRARQRYRTRSSARARIAECRMA